MLGKKKKKFPVFISALLYWGKKSLDSLAFLLKKKKKRFGCSCFTESIWNASVQS